MNDPQTTVLYTLSTLAQTCAALAAFVGAVGIFRLQSLRDRRREAESEMRRVFSTWGLLPTTRDFSQHNMRWQYHYHCPKSSTSSRATPLRILSGRPQSGGGGTRQMERGQVGCHT